MDWLNYFIILLGISIYKRVIAKDTIFVADLTGQIWKAPLDTVEFEEIPLQNVQNPVAVDYDPVDHKLYWTDVKVKAISRTNLDGTEQEVVLPYLSVPDGLSIDVENRHLYWTDTGTDTIERANMDGSGRQVILQENFQEPRAIVVDSPRGRMFWTDWGDNSKIERANLDGSQRVVLVDTDLQLPNGLALDIPGNRMYWCDAGLNMIETTDLDGQNRINLGTFQAITVGFDIHPFDIGVYNNDVYWSDWSVLQLLKMNKYAGRQANGVGPGVFQQAGGLHICLDTVNECSSNPCNAGVCSDEINHYTCNCTLTEFEGTQCQINTDKCLSYPCLNSGRCTDLVNGFTCECGPGFSGDVCQYNIDECLSSPCLNAGQCDDGINGFTCTCVSGFSGDVCQYNTDECLSSPCLNAGQCGDEINGFTCNCLSGFNGNVCQYNTDECLSYPCRNGGRCNDGINGFTCECVTGFNGNVCQYSFQSTASPCSNQPCPNGATCVPEGNIYTCQCPEGYTGNNCQTEITSTRCLYSGDIKNGHVIQGKDGDTYAPGKSLEFVCKDGYNRVGAQTVYCLTGGTWSEEKPTCVNPGSKETFVSSTIIYGGGAGGALLIIILIVILIVVCCKKRHSTTNQDLPNPTVHYTTEVTTAPKEFGIYNTAYDNASTQYHPSAPTTSQTLRTPVPLPRPKTQSNHIYDDVNNMYGAGAAESFPREHPPSYISVIDHKMRENEEHGIDNGYLALNISDVSVPLYDVPK